MKTAFSDLQLERAIKRTQLSQLEMAGSTHTNSARSEHLLSHVEKTSQSFFSFQTAVASTEVCARTGHRSIAVGQGVTHRWNLASEGVLQQRRTAVGIPTYVLVDEYLSEKIRQYCRVP